MAQELLDRRFDADKVRALAGGISRWFELGYDLT